MQTKINTPKHIKHYFLQPFRRKKLEYDLIMTYLYIMISKIFLNKLFKVKKKVFPLFREKYNKQCIFLPQFKILQGG